MTELALASTPRSISSTVGGATVSLQEAPPCSWTSIARRPATMGCSRDSARQFQAVIYAEIGSTERPTSAGSVCSQSSAGACTKHQDVWGLRICERKMQSRHLAGKGDVIHNCKRLGLAIPVTQSAGSSDVLALPVKPRMQASAYAVQESQSSPQLTQVGLEWGAGIGTLDRDQPHLQHFLNYKRYHGMPFRYKGKRDPKFTDDVFNVTGEPAHKEKVSYPKRYTARGSLTNLHDLRQTQPRLSPKHTLDKSCIPQAKMKSASQDEVKPKHVPSPSSTVDGLATTCNVCGNVYMDDALFCRKCGNPRQRTRQLPKAGVVDKQPSRSRVS